MKKKNSFDWRITPCLIMLLVCVMGVVWNLGREAGVASVPSSEWCLKAKGCPEPTGVGQSEIEFLNVSRVYVPVTVVSKPVCTLVRVVYTGSFFNNTDNVQRVNEGLFYSNYSSFVTKSGMFVSWADVEKWQEGAANRTECNDSAFIKIE